MKYFLFLLLIPLIACQSEEDEYVKIPESYNFNIPENFPDPTYDFANNPLTKQGVALGKDLFYDGNLASDGIVSCAFCHIQNNAFTHHGHTVSHGVNDRMGTRNSPPLQNLAFQKYFMWDGVAENLDLVSIIPITAEFEMDHNLPEIMDYLNSNSSYRKKFTNAFGVDEVNAEYFLKALSQFLVTLVSSNSKYDRVLRNEGEVFTESEAMGQSIFNSKCAQCHSGSLFTNQEFSNNGLPINPNVNDKGRFGFTDLSSDLYKFKIPSLRNVALTAPYMHDGRFLNLDAVLDFYDRGVQNTQNLDSKLIQSSGRLGIPLTADEKQHLKSFLHTLTDFDFISNPQHSEY